MLLSLLFFCFVLPCFVLFVDQVPRVHYRDVRPEQPGILPYPDQVVDLPMASDGVDPLSQVEQPLVFTSTSSTHVPIPSDNFAPPVLLNKKRKGRPRKLDSTIERVSVGNCHAICSRLGLVEISSIPSHFHGRELRMRILNYAATLTEIEVDQLFSTIDQTTRQVQD